MRRYFFDLSDGTRERDETGTFFPDEHGAQRAAIRYAGEVLEHDPDRLTRGAVRVYVTDEMRTIRLLIEISLERLPLLS